MIKEVFFCGYWEIWEELMDGGVWSFRGGNDLFRDFNGLDGVCGGLACGRGGFCREAQKFNVDP